MSRIRFVHFDIEIKLFFSFFTNTKFYNLIAVRTYSINNDKNLRYMRLKTFVFCSSTAIYGTFVFIRAIVLTLHGFTININTLLKY